MTATPSPQERPVRPGRMAREQRHEHLLDVAADLIVAEGLDAVTMEGVAARAGVSKGLGYAYFGNRDELLVALFDREAALFDERIATVLAGSGPGLDAKLRAVFTAGLDHTVERGLLTGALLQAKLTDGPLESRRKQRQGVVNRFFVAMVQEEIGLDANEASVAVTILLAANAGALEAWLGRRMKRPQITDTFVRMAMGALEALANPCQVRQSGRPAQPTTAKTAVRPRLV